MSNLGRKILDKLTPWYHEHEAVQRDARTNAIAARADAQKRRVNAIIQSYVLADVVFERRETNKENFKWKN